VFFLNLSLPEFLVLFSTISAAVVTLYLLSRARRRQVVSTLQFWTSAEQAVSETRRKRIQEPWSLILQLLALLLLTLAIAQLRWGSPEQGGSDHVLLLDTSSWTAARVNGETTVLDQAKRSAQRWVRTLGPDDRVMIIHAAAVPSPVTGLESDKKTLSAGIDRARPSASALNLRSAVEFASRLRSVHAQRPGEIVFSGALRTGSEAIPDAVPSGFRILPVESPEENAGLTSISARRSETNSDEWELLLAVRNYGKTARELPVAVHFGNAPVASHVFELGPGQSEAHVARFRTGAAGWVEAKLFANDAFVEDDRAILELPPSERLRVAVFTAESELLRPLFGAHPRVQVEFHSHAAYRPNVAADVFVFDRFRPSPPPGTSMPAIWIDPPANASPFRARQKLAEAKPVDWRPEQPVARGLRSKELRAAAGSTVFAKAVEDEVVASVADGPVILARPSERAIALGFHPGRKEMRSELATPLLIANVLEWLQPDAFRTSEVRAIPVGAVSTRVAAAQMRAQPLRVYSDKGDLPFTIADEELRFFSADPGIVRVNTGTGEEVFSLSLPEIADTEWEPPASVRRGMPAVWQQAFARDLWPWLAAAGALILVVEWLLYGRRRRVPIWNPAAAQGEPSAWRKAS
jgi:hypothetical protein